MERINTEEAEQVIYNAAKKIFGGVVSGGVYLSECRPKDSKKEDVVVVVSAMNALQVQTGRAKVNVYVKDISTGRAKTIVPNKARLREILGYENSLIDELNKANANYDFRLNLASTTYPVAGTQEHFANFNIEFNCITI